MLRRVRVLPVILALYGCHIVPDQQYRPTLAADPSTSSRVSIACLQQSEDAQKKLKTWTIEPLDDGGADFALAVLEFRDNGNAWDRRQYEYVMDNIRKLAFTNDGAVIVVFAHGWKNNAEECNDNVRCFREVLRFLATIEREKARRARAAGQDAPARHIIGVYIGWRGQRIDGTWVAWLPKQLTFWPIKNTARLVGSGICKDWTKDTCNDPGGVRAAIDELAHVYTSMRKWRRTSRMVVVGHSFGAQVVYAALHDRLAESLRRDEIVEGLGNLVVLVNPAFEAAQHSDLDHLIRIRKFSLDEQPPLLLTISTTNDWATHFLFPVGQLLSPTLRWRSLDWLTTIGNYPRYRTHTLTTIPERLNGIGSVTFTPPDKCSSADGAPRACSCQTDLRALTLQLAALRSTTVPVIATTRQTCADVDIGGARLHALVTCTPGTPLLNISTDKSIIDGHSGIFNKPFANFVIAYVVAHDPELAPLTR